MKLNRSLKLTCFCLLCLVATRIILFLFLADATKFWIYFAECYFSYKLPDRLNTKSFGESLPSFSLRTCTSFMMRQIFQKKFYYNCSGKKKIIVLRKLRNTKSDLGVKLTLRAVIWNTKNIVIFVFENYYKKSRSSVRIIFPTYFFLRRS